ncbi:hypothetical protein Hdeb2414_s0006g00219431 [Helianthus debilis subsp. tardiflorus]
MSTNGGVGSNWNQSRRWPTTATVRFRIRPRLAQHVVSDQVAAAVVSLNSGTATPTPHVPLFFQRRRSEAEEKRNGGTACGGDTVTVAVVLCFRRISPLVQDRVG